MEINIDKSQVMRVPRSNESLQIKLNNRELIIMRECVRLRPRGGVSLSFAAIFIFGSPGSQPRAVCPGNLEKE